MEANRDFLKELAEVKARQDIMELQYRYIHAVDKKDWRGAVEVFHPDAKLYLFDRGKERLFANRGEIEYFYSGIAGKEFTFSRHYIVNPIVEIHGDKAVFKSYYNALYIQDTYTWVIFGTYEDQLVRENGHWKLMVKSIDHGWNDFLLPLKELKLKKEEIKEAKKRIFV